MPKTRKQGLTPRQEEVYRLFVNGYDRDEIAKKLSIAPATVKEHVKGILKEKDAKTIAELLQRQLRGINTNDRESHDCDS